MSSFLWPWVRILPCFLCLFCQYNLLSHTIISTTILNAFSTILFIHSLQKLTFSSIESQCFDKAYISVKPPLPFSVGMKKHVQRKNRALRICKVHYTIFLHHQNFRWKTKQISSQEQWVKNWQWMLPIINDALLFSQLCSLKSSPLFLNSVPYYGTC